VNLLAHTLMKNIPKCTSEEQLQATESLIRSHLVARYPAAEAQKYITHLKWALFFRRVELGLNKQVIDN
jgi:hypothetical protein